MRDVAAAEERIDVAPLDLDDVEDDEDPKEGDEENEGAGRQEAVNI